MNSNFEKLKPYLEKNMAFNSALGLFSWDTETVAPKDAAEQSAKVIGLLAAASYESVINPEVKALVLALTENDEGLNEVEKGIVKELSKEYEKLEKIPSEEFGEYSELTSLSAVKWAEAKKENNYDIFMPVLAKVIQYKKKFASYRKKDGETLYDVLLREFEEDFTSEKLDRVFEKMKKAILPLLKKIKEKPQVQFDFLFRNYDIEKQKQFVRFLAEYVGFSFDKAVLAESEHPFTGGIHNKDVRITTHYYDNNLESGIFSVIHEVGHGLYEMNIPDELTQTLVGEGSSMGLHESQSRFYENLIGRNKAFWEPIYQKLQDTYSEQLKDISLEAFMKGINRTETSLIRTEADELTYSLHVLIRYEIEKKIFNEDYPVEKLPELWNSLYEEYLGIRPENFSEGMLQDIHWSQGSFGYFPSYVIGSAVSAQLLHQLKKEIDFEETLRKGELSKILSWLTDKVHKYGKLKKTNEILLLATGETFNEDYYIDYLIKKFSEEYSL